MLMWNYQESIGYNSETNTPHLIFSILANSSSIVIAIVRNVFHLIFNN